MASNTEVTQELVIRARDLSTETLVRVGQAVDQLTNRLDKYVAEAEKGTGGTVALNNSLRDADKGFGVLARNAATIEKYVEATARLTEVTDKRDQSKQALADFKKDLPPEKKRTDEQSSEFERLKAEAAANQKEWSAVTRTINTTSAALNRLGIEHGQEKAALDQITAARERLAAAITAGTRAEEGYAAAAGRVRSKERIEMEAGRELANDARAEAAQRAAKEAEGVRNVEAAARAKERAGREYVQEYKRLLDEKDAREEKELADIRRMLQEEISLVKNAIRDRKAAEDKAAEDRKRKQLEQAEAAKLSAATYDYYRQGADTQAQGGFPAVKTTATVDGLRAIMNPAQEARSVLSGLVAEINTVNQAMSALTLKENDAKDGLKTLALAGNELQRQAGLVDAFKNQRIAFGESRDKADALGHKLKELQDKVNSTGVASKEMSAEINKTGNDFLHASNAVKSEKDALEILSAALRKAGIDSSKLDQETERMAVAADKLTAASIKANAAAFPNKSKEKGFLGLQPYELQNLSYQVNDVFTGIASGQHITQIAAQQGGQIFQLFNKNLFESGTLMLKLAAWGGLAAVAISTFVHVFEQADSIRNFNARLTLFNDTNRTTGTELTATARNLQAYGLSFDEARAAISTFMEHNVNPADFEKLGKAALDMSDVLGVKVPEAAKALAEGFTGGYDSLVKLDGQLHFMTPALENQIKELTDAGQAGEAYKIAMGAVTDKLKDAEKQAISPLTSGIRSVKAAWNDFLTALGPIALRIINAVSTDLKDLLAVIKGIQYVSSLLTGNSTATPEQARVQLPALQTQLNAARERVSIAREAGEGQNPADNRGRESEYEKARRNLEVVEKTFQQTRAIAELDGQGPQAAQTARIEANQREATSANRLAEAWKDVVARRFDPKLTGQAATDADKAIIDKMRADLNQAAGGVGITDINRYPDLVRARDAKLDDEKRRMDEQRLALRNKEWVGSNDPIENARIDAQGANLRGREAQEFDRAKAEKRIRELIAEKATRDRMDADTWLKDENNQKSVAELRQALYDAYDRKRDTQEKKGSDRRQNAEEGLEKQLLSIREKLDNADKTNIDRRLRAVDEEFAKYDIMIAKAKRAGVGSVAGQDLAAFQAELASLKEQRKEQVAIEASEVGINAKLQERKTAIDVINARIRDGSLAFPEGMKQAEMISAKMTPQITKMATDTLAIVKALAGAEPSPKLAALIAKLEAILARPESVEPTKAGNKGESTQLQSIDSGIAAAEGRGKTRDEIERANRTLMDRGAQGYYASQEKIKGAYERSTGEIRKQTAELRKQLEVEKAAGRISDDQFELRSAQLDEINAKTVYQSDLQKGLQKEIANSFGQRTGQFMDSMIESITELAKHHIKLGEAIKQIGLAFANMVAGILMDIGKWILKTLIQIELQALLDVLSGGTSMGAGAASSGASSLVGAVKVHEGGMVGSSANTRVSFPREAFINAPRFHTGGIVGLQPDEQPAILQRGEEVLSKTDPRNMANGGGRGQAESAPTNIRQVLVMDPAQLSSAMAGKHGERTVVTHIRNNAAELRQILR